MKFTILIIVSLLFAGCASQGTRAAMTSGEIGCPVSELQISDGDMGWTTNTWTATCRDKTFFCTYTSSYNMNSRTQCTEGITLQNN